MAFKVIGIIDGDTIRVSPDWSFNGIVGDIVKVSGYGTPPESHQAFATQKLSDLLLNKSIELRDAQYFNAHSTALICRVLLNGVDISKYFPEYPINSMYNPPTTNTGSLFGN